MLREGEEAPVPAMHALIIEDEGFTACYLQAVLLECGFTSFALADDGLKAVAAARRRRPDLITADLGLAQGHGLTAVRTIHCMLGEVPVVYITGDATLLEGEAAPVVGKPFTTTGLRRACETALGRSEKAAAA